MKVILFSHTPWKTERMAEDLRLNGFQVSFVTSLDELFISLAESLDSLNLFVFDCPALDRDYVNPYELLLWYGAQEPFVMVSFSGLDGPAEWKKKNRNQLNSMKSRDRKLVEEAFSLMSMHKKSSSLKQESPVKDSLLFSSPDAAELAFDKYKKDCFSGLPRSRMKVLEYFLERPDRIITVEEAISHIWPNEGDDAELKDRFYAYVHHVRVFLCQEGTIGDLHRTGKNSYLFTPARKINKIQRSYLMEHKGIGHVTSAK